MNTGLENKSDSFIVSQFREAHGRAAHALSSAPGITISPQAGSGAHEIAEQAAGILQRGELNASQQWSVYDRQLVEKVVEEHFLPKQVARHMPEDRRSTIQDVTEELLGVRPPSWVLVPMVSETILHLVESGHVIIIGRGATAITSRLPGVFHVRIVASLASRIERVQRMNNLNQDEARRFIEREDRGARRYVRAYFHTRVEDELLYHLVINTDRVALDEAAALIVEGARRCFRDSVSSK